MKQIPHLFPPMPAALPRAAAGLLALGALSYPTQASHQAIRKAPAEEALSEFSSEALSQDLPDFLVIKDGAAQPVRAFRGKANEIQEALFVETSFDSDGDGRMDRVYVDVTRPKATEGGAIKVAAIYETSPYFWGIAGNGTEFFWDPRHAIGETPPMHEHPPEIAREEPRLLNSNSYISTFVRRGFAVVHSASPGTGFSQGCPTIGGDNESLAPKAVIDWMNGRAKAYKTVDGDEEVVCDWCTGKVGMIGTSYNGTLPLAAATTGVEGLETIVPVAPNTSYYHYYRSNGLVRHPGGYMGEDIDVLYDFVHSGEPSRRPWCNENVRDKALLANLDRVTGDYSEWWAGRDYLNRVDGVKCSVLMAHGWNDWNVMPEHSVRIRERLKELGRTTICYYHQGGHGGDPPKELLVRWFTRYLYGVQNGVENGPKAFIVREGDRRTKPTAYADYPHPKAAPVTLYPAGDGSSVGTLSDEGPSSGRLTIVDDVSVDGESHAKADGSKHRLLFASAPLMAPVHFSGTYRVKLRLTSDRPAANLSVWLVSLPWTDRATINENIISRGWADPQNAKSIWTSEPLVPGQFVDMEFDLQPDDQIVPVGERIGLMVFSSDADFTLKPDAGTELTFDLSSCSITLPVVGGPGAWGSAFDF